MKHAYLIIAHHNYDQLRTLLSLLDDERNDIYLHRDKKARDFSPELLEGAVSRASLQLIKRRNVTWGGYSQMRVSLALLKEATATQHGFYHLISGADLPLKTQDEIHRFFEDKAGTEYVVVEDCFCKDDEPAERVRYFYPFQDYIGRDRSPFKNLLRQLQGKLIALQKRLKISRIPASSPYVWKGPNWFSISHSAAEHLLSRRKEIAGRFRFTSCGDEFYLQTVFMTSPFRDSLADSNLRYIDWERGMPYTFTGEDYELLINSGMLFARKFDPAHPEIIEMIAHALKTG